MFNLLVAFTCASRRVTNRTNGCSLAANRNNIPDCYREIGYNARLTRPFKTGLTMNTNPIEPASLRHSTLQDPVGLEWPEPETKESGWHYLRTDRAIVREATGIWEICGWMPRRIDRTYIRQHQTREHS
jgi:hypothetical protein